MSTTSEGRDSGLGDRVGAAPQRRALRFASPAEALADAERIAAADKRGVLRCCGEWAPGQALGHVAAWIDYGFDGYPLVAPPDMVAMARARLPVVLKDGMRPGVRIPGVEGGTTGTERMPCDEALSRLRRAWARVQREAPRRAHAFFGEMTHEQWIQLHLRHSELHQGFFVPEG